MGQTSLDQKRKEMIKEKNIGIKWLESRREKA